MAYTKILVVHNRLDGCVRYALNEDKTSLASTIDYALNRDKTEKTCFESAINCEVSSAYEDMIATKRRWGKENRKRKGYHIIQSFVPGEVTPEQAHTVGVELANRLLGERYEAVIATHLDKAHLHNHIVFNSVSFMNGAMYKDTMRDYYHGIRGMSDEVCRKHGLSIIEPDGDAPKRSRPEWEGRLSVRNTIRSDIDRALAGAYTFDRLLYELRKLGYQVSTGNRKYIAVRPPGGERNIRLNSLGNGYTEQDLRTRLAAVRSGKAQPAFKPEPLPRTIYAGRQYRVKSTAKHRHRRLSGFQRLCFRYLVLLGVVRRGRTPPRTPYSVRREAARLDRYQRQFAFLRQNRIDTAEQLSMQYDALQAKMDALTDERSELYRRKRRGDETAGQRIAEITERLKPLRRDLRMCAQIEEDMERMRRDIADVRAEKAVIHDKLRRRNEVQR